MGVASEHDADEPAVSRLLQELAQLNQDLSVPSPRAYGIDERRWQELLPVMAGQALAASRAEPDLAGKPSDADLYH